MFLGRQEKTRTERILKPEILVFYQFTSLSAELNTRIYSNMEYGKTTFKQGLSVFFFNEEKQWLHESY